MSVLRNKEIPVNKYHKKKKHTCISKLAKMIFLIKLRGINIVSFNSSSPQLSRQESVINKNNQLRLLAMSYEQVIQTLGLKLMA